MQDLPGLLPAQVIPGADAPAPAARPRLRVVPDEPLDFDAAVRTLTPRLVRYAARRLGDAHEAEEVVQEALLRAYKHRTELLTEDDLAAWSTCVTGRLVIDRLRVRGRATSVADVPEGTRVGRDTADVVVARDEARTALDALDAMPPRQAAVLWAREVEGLGYDEIGARFGMTEPAVRSILTRARKALRKEYAARGGTLPAGGLAAIAPWADGLGWLERLRGAMGRITAPAALGVATTGLLAGGLFAIPSISPVTDAPALTPATVVTVAGELPSTADAVLHGMQAPVVVATATLGRKPVVEAPVEPIANGAVGAVTHELCTEATRDRLALPTGHSIAYPAGAQLPDGVGIGDMDCAKGSSPGHLVITSPVGDPTGGLVGSSVVAWLPEPCPATFTSPVASCTNPSEESPR
jgi:RNA polymerase sigma factor (sigma-70 family)